LEGMKTNLKFIIFTNIIYNNS